MESPLPITVLIPCKNEQENLHACLASARLIAAEILVADSGSTDASRQIAQDWGCRIIQRDYVNSGDFKNWAIPQAKYTWILVLDADERITPELAHEIRQLLSSHMNLPESLQDSQGETKRNGPKLKSAYRIPRQNYFLGSPIRYGDWACDKVIRLLQRDRCQYSNQTDHAEIDLPAADVGELRQFLVHHTAWDLRVYLDKMTHYALQQATHAHQQGCRLSWTHMALNGPMRFLRGFVLRQGFRDGRLGLLIAGLTAYYSFLKQAFLYQMQRGKDRSECDLVSANVHPAQDRGISDSRTAA